MDPKLEPVNNEGEGVLVGTSKRIMNLGKVILAGLALSGSVHASESVGDDSRYNLEDKGENQYVITDKETGRSIGFYDSADSGKGVKDFGKSLFQDPMSIPQVKEAIELEKAFQKSGLVALKEKPQGKLHFEERLFNGYGINVKNKVLVDEKGEVAQLVEVRDVDSNEVKYTAMHIDTSNVSDSDKVATSAHGNISNIGEGGDAVTTTEGQDSVAK